MEYEEINETIAEATQNSEWSVAALDEELLQIKDCTLDDTLRLIRMKKAIYSFPVPELEKDVYAGVQLFYSRCEKKKAGLFAGKSSKLDAKIHNALIPVWKEKCQEIILESQLKFEDNQQMSSVLNSYTEKLNEI